MLWTHVSSITPRLVDRVPLASLERAIFEPEGLPTVFDLGNLSQPTPLTRIQRMNKNCRTKCHYERLARELDVASHTANKGLSREVSPLSTKNIFHRISSTDGEDIHRIIASPSRHVVHNFLARAYSPFKFQSSHSGDRERDRPFWDGRTSWARNYNPQGMIGQVRRVKAIKAELQHFVVSPSETSSEGSLQFSLRWTNFPTSS